MAASVGTQAILAPSAARTASGVGDSITRGGLGRFLVQLLCSAASGTTPTLNVYIQTSVDGGTTWQDVGAFTQLTAAATRFMRIVAGGAIPNVVEEAQKDAALTAGTVESGPLGQLIRAKWVVAGTTPSFTFAVSAWAEEDS